MKSASIIARVNGWAVLLFGLVYGIYESSTKITTSYPYQYVFDWWLFIKWCLGAYFVSMIFYLLSELFKKLDILE